MDHWMSSLLLTKQEAALSASNWVWLRSSHTDTCETFSSVMPFRLAVNNIVNMIILPTNMVSGFKNVTKRYFNRVLSLSHIYIYIYIYIHIYIYTHTESSWNTRNRFRGVFFLHRSNENEIETRTWVLRRLVVELWPISFLEDSYKKWGVNPFTWKCLFISRWF
jgi:hypothetical protein